MQILFFFFFFFFPAMVPFSEFRTLICQCAKMGKVRRKIWRWEYKGVLTLAHTCSCFRLPSGALPDTARFRAASLCKVSGAFANIYVKIYTHIYIYISYIYIYIYKCIIIMTPIFWRLPLIFGSTLRVSRNREKEPSKLISENLRRPVNFPTETEGSPRLKTHSSVRSLLTRQVAIYLRIWHWASETQKRIFIILL